VTRALAPAGWTKTDVLRLDRGEARASTPAPKANPTLEGRAFASGPDHRAMISFYTNACKRIIALTPPPSPSSPDMGVLQSVVVYATSVSAPRADSRTRIVSGKEGADECR